jgi:hypothetical protein
MKDNNSDDNYQLQKPYGVKGVSASVLFFTNVASTKAIVFN